MLFTTLLQFPHHLHPRGTLSHYFSSSSLFITPSFNRTTKILLYPAFCLFLSRQTHRSDKIGSPNETPACPRNRHTAVLSRHISTYSAPYSRPLIQTHNHRASSKTATTILHDVFTILPYQSHRSCKFRSPIGTPTYARAPFRPDPASTVPTLLYRGYSPSPQPDSRPRIQLHHHRASRRNETAKTPQPAH